MVHLYADFYEKQYKISACSCLAFVWMFFFGFTLIVPFMEAYYSGGKLIALTDGDHRAVGQAADVL